MRPLSRKAQSLVTSFDDAVACHAWSGAGEPDDDEKLKPEYLKAKAKLCDYIQQLENELRELKEKANGAS